MKKINLIQFLPYFPPHKGGLETVSEELGYFYSKKGFGDVINVTFDVGQNYDDENLEYIFHKNKKNGYKNKNYLVFLIPSFDLISNFPVPKFWKKEFFIVLKLIKSLVKEKTHEFVFQTHTRFFLSSLIGGIFAKIFKIKWVHVEHGSDYVKLSSTFKSKLSYIYDRIFGKWIFKNCDKIVAISNGVKKFVESEFGISNDKIKVIYNGINFDFGEKVDNGDVINIGFVGRLVKLKGVDLLLEAFYELSKKYSNLNLQIVGDGEEKENLEKLCLEKGIKNVEFLGMKNRGYIGKEFLPKIDILVNPSFQEGLPTSVIEGLLASCVVVASDVGGTREISEFDDLIVVEKGRIDSLIFGIEKGILNYRELRGESRKNVVVKFDWYKNIDKYFSLYKKM